MPYTFNLKEKQTMNPENETKQWWTPRRLMAAKVVTIGILTLLLMIPMMMIENLIGERERTGIHIYRMNLSLRGEHR